MADAEKIAENLKDAGCNSGFIEAFMRIPEENNRERLAMLEKHRNSLLDKYHKDIRQLECLDYFIYHINKKCK